MLQQALCRLITLAVLLAASTAVRGQEPAPVKVQAAPLAEAGTFNLVLAWRYHPGDDSRWADPAFDDSGWELVEPILAPGGKLPRGGWRGTGWFRRHLRVEPALWGEPLVIRVKTPGATQVFLDGSPLMDATAAGGVWREVVFSPRTDHVLAVRHTVSSAEGAIRSGDPGFFLSLERTDARAIELASERRSTTRLAVFTLLPAFLTAFLALLHLSLFLSYPKARENLFYALAMAACAAIFLSDLRGARATNAAELTVALRFVTSSALAATFFGLLTYYTLRTRTFPRTWIAFAAVGVALMSWAVFHPNPPFDWIWNGYLGLMAVEMIHVEATGRRVRREGTGILLAGFVILIVIFVLQLLIILELAPPVAGGSIYGFGILAVVLAMSLFLVRSFARTNLHLERRLDEVKALSETVLAQERAAHEQELRRCLLEAENARKTSEIEAARTLQLSMLPTTLPAVEGLETAAAMATASEVGGDYYDFRSAPDGSLVVAFGDATGHGVAAGIMVTAVKALFSTLGGGESLSAVLAECDRVLRAMQVKPLHMCLTLARLTPRSVTLCSAGMPPVLIHRAGSGEMEELGTGGRPVGSRLSGHWNERSASLSPGDTLLFASDGFAEQLDPADNPLGYERLAEIFRASAGVPARELVERLLARVKAWRGEREQSDDITLVVVRTTSGGSPRSEDQSSTDSCR